LLQRKIYVYFSAWLAAVKETKLKDVQNHILSIFALKAKLWVEETKELDVFETEISWNLKGLVAIAIATAVRKKKSRPGRALGPVFRAPPMVGVLVSPPLPPPRSEYSSLRLATNRPLKNEKFKVEKNRCINYTKIQKYV
jgi:hypothetical protein